jgi:hypothetical protein
MLDWCAICGNDSAATLMPYGRSSGLSRCRDSNSCGARRREQEQQWDIAAAGPVSATRVFIKPWTIRAYLRSR